MQESTSSFRWFNKILQGQYLQSLSINYIYVAINKDLEKLPSQLY